MLSYPDFPLRWTRDGRVWVLGADGVVSSVDESDGTSRVFGRLPEVCVTEGFASITEDGRYLTCAIDETKESDVWVADRLPGS